jgi:hypothetical protein
MQSFGCFSTLAFKLLPAGLPGRTPKSEFQRAAQMASVAIQAAGTKSVVLPRFYHIDE